ncbi:MAG: ABC transporter permease [Ignavibacteria bacterium]|nr:ABC transporter permease [Ignavibacteria bacterium]
MNKQELNNVHNYSQFKATLSITKASLRSIVRNPSSIIFTLLFPLIFIVVFGFIGSGGSARFDVGFYSTSNNNNQLFHSLITVENFNVVQDLTDGELDSRLEKGEVDAIFKITKNPQGILPEYVLEIKTNKAKPEKSSLIRLITGQVISNFNISLVKEQPPVAVIKQTDVEGRLFKTIDFILPGQLGFSILSAGVFGTAFVFISLRENLVIKRFFATPINRNNIVLGEALSRLIFSISGSVIIIGIGHFLFGFTLVNGFWTFLNMLAVSALGLVVFLGIGFLVSNIAKNINTVPPIANLVTLPQFLLAGTFFSIDVFPSWLQPVSRAMPLTYLNDALRKIAFDGATIFTLPKELLILTVWGVVIYFFAIKFFKWE